MDWRIVGAPKALYAMIFTFMCWQRHFRHSERLTLLRHRVYIMALEPHWKIGHDQRGHLYHKAYHNETATVFQPLDYPHARSIYLVQFASC